MCECEGCVHSTLKGEQDCACKCESLHYRERVCVSVRDNMNYFVFAGSLTAFEGDCLSTKLTLNFI